MIDPCVLCVCRLYPAGAIFFCLSTCSVVHVGKLSHDVHCMSGRCFPRLAVFLQPLMPCGPCVARCRASLISLWVANVHQCTYSSVLPQGIMGALLYNKTLRCIKGHFGHFVSSMLPQGIIWRPCYVRGWSVSMLMYYMQLPGKLVQCTEGEASCLGGLKCVCVVFLRSSHPPLILSDGFPHLLETC